MKKKSYIGDRACMQAIMDTGDLQEQLQFVTSLHQKLINYKTFFGHARKLSLEHPHCYQGLNQRVKDKAYNLEQEVRIATKFGLDAVNKIKDTNSLSLLSRSFAIKDKESLIGPERLKMIEKNLSEHVAEIEPLFLKEAGELIRTYDISARYEVKPEPFVSGQFKDKNGDKQKFEMQLRSTPGSLARVSSYDLFKTDFLKVTSTLTEPEKCHGQPPQFLKLPVKILPWVHYEKMVEVLIMGKDCMYKHARQVDELGLVAFRGNAYGGEIAFIIALVIIIIAALASTGLTIACIVQNASNQDVCISALVLGILAGAVAGIEAGRYYGVGNSKTGTTTTTSYPLTVGIY